MTSDLFVVFATDRADATGVRAATRETHRAYLRQVHPDGLLVVLAGPTLGDDVDGDEGPMNGTMLVVRAASLAAVERFVAGDPYSRASLFGEVTIRRWRCGLALPEQLVSARDRNNGGMP